MLFLNCHFSSLRGKLCGMKKLIPLLVVGACIVIGCKPLVEEERLEPGQVLRLSATASQSLESADFSATFSASVDVSEAGPIDLSGTVNGTMQNAGKQLRFSLDASGGRDQAEDSIVIAGALEAIVAGKQEVYINIGSLVLSPEEELIQPETIAMIQNQWWKLPSADEFAQDNVAITPNPRLLKAQAEVVKILEDKGMATIDDRESYHYEVEVDKTRLLEYLRKVSEEDGTELDEEKVEIELAPLIISGELWIDAETYFVRQLEWDIDNMDDEDFGISFKVTFSNHNEAGLISPPEEFKVFSPFMFMQPDEGTLPYNDLDIEEYDDLTEAEQQQMILELLNGGEPLPFPTE